MLSWNRSRSVYKICDFTPTVKLFLKIMTKIYPKQVNLEVFHTFLLHFYTSVNLFKNLNKTFKLFDIYHGSWPNSSRKNSASWDG